MGSLSEALFAVAVVVDDDYEAVSEQNTGSGWEMCDAASQ